MHPPPQINGIPEELLLAVEQMKDLPIPPGARPDSPPKTVLYNFPPKKILDFLLVPKSL